MLQLSTDAGPALAPGLALLIASLPRTTAPVIRPTEMPAEPATPLVWPGAAVLRACRKAAGLTRQALAAEAELCRSTITILETGQRPNPHYQTLARLANVLRVNLAALLLGDPALIHPAHGAPYSVLWAGSERLRHWREAHGMTIEMLRERAQVDRDVLRGMERGSLAISYTTLASIANALEVPLVALIPELTPPPSTPAPLSGEPRFWTVAEACARTGMTHNQLYQLITRGRVVAGWQGTTRVIEVASLVAWTTRHQHDGRGRAGRGRATGRSHSADQEG